MNKQTLLKILELVPDDVEITFSWDSIKSAQFDRPTNILILAKHDISTPKVNDWALSGAPVIFTQGRFFAGTKQNRAEFDHDFHSGKYK